jgi:hypothetical protein
MKYEFFDFSEMDENLANFAAVVIFCLLFYGRKKEMPSGMSESKMHGKNNIGLKLFDELENALLAKRFVNEAQKLYQVRVFFR